MMASPRPSRGKLHMTAKTKFIRDDVRSGSRQYEYYFGGELTALDLTLDAVRV